MSSLASLRRNTLLARTRFGALLAVCLLLRALIPTGYMPGNLLAGEFMVLCPQGIPATVAADLHAGHFTHDDGAGIVADAGRNCPIGSALVPVAPPPFEPAAQSLASSNTSYVAITVTQPTVAPQRSYWSRAPPQQLS